MSTLVSKVKGFYAESLDELIIYINDFCLRSGVEIISISYSSNSSGSSKYSAIICYNKRIVND